MNIWPFGKRKEEIRADTEDGFAQAEITPECDSVLLSALMGKNNISKKKALEIPTVSACLNLIGETIASLPIKLYEKEEEGVKEITDDRRTFLLNKDTGDTMTGTQFWKAILEDYYLGKGGYAYINTDGMKYRSIHYVDESYVSIQKNSDPIFKDYNILVNGTGYFPHQFFKLLRKTKDGMQSRSILEESTLQLSVAHNSLIYENNLVKKGGNKRGFLQATKKMSQEAIDRLKKAFRLLYSNNEENVVVLNDGMTFKESSNTSVEMQLNENKDSNAKEICKLIGVPAGMICGNPTQKDYDNYIILIANLLSDIECSLNRDLLLETEKNIKYFSYDTKELTRGNIKERFEAYEVALRSNFLQIDEVRKMEDWPSIGLDWITLGLDSVLYNPKTGEVYTPNTNKSQKMSDLKIGGDENES